MVPDKWLQIEVAYSPAAGQVVQIKLQLMPGTNALQAVQKSGLVEQYPELQTQSLALGIWGRRCTSTTVLRHLDRVEIYRSLHLSPMEARRLRHRNRASVGSSSA
jgi:uncharacterized protein